MIGTRHAVAYFRQLVFDFQAVLAVCRHPLLQLQLATGGGNADGDSAATRSLGTERRHRVAHGVVKGRLRRAFGARHAAHGNTVTARRRTL